MPPSFFSPDTTWTGTQILLSEQHCVARRGLLLYLMMGGSVRPLLTGGQDSPTGRPEAARRASARDGASQSRSSVQIEEPTSGSVFCFKASANPLAGETRHRRGPEKTVCLDTWPSAAQPIPSLSPLCSLPADRGYAPRAASPLSLTAYFAK